MKTDSIPSWIDLPPTRILLFLVLGYCAVFAFRMNSAMNQAQSEYHASQGIVNSTANLEPEGSAAPFVSRSLPVRLIPIAFSAVIAFFSFGLMSTLLVIKSKIQSRRGVGRLDQIFFFEGSSRLSKLALVCCALLLVYGFAMGLARRSYALDKICLDEFARCGDERSYQVTSLFRGVESNSPEMVFLRPRPKLPSYGLLNWQVSANDFGNYLITGLAVLVGLTLAFVSNRGSHVKLAGNAPGAKLLIAVDFFYSKTAVEETFKPIIADWRMEYFDALKENRTWKARWICFRWTYRFIQAMGLSAVFSILKAFTPSLRM